MELAGKLLSGVLEKESYTQGGATPQNSLKSCGESCWQWGGGAHPGAPHDGGDQAGVLGEGESGRCAPSMRTPLQNC